MMRCKACSNQSVRPKYDMDEWKVVEFVEFVGFMGFVGFE